MATNTLVVNTTTANTSYTANLSPGKPYRWNVAACNSSGCSSFTTVLYFQTPADTPTVPATPTGTSPGSTSSPGPTTASSTVTLNWNASSGTTSYDVGVRDIAANTLVVNTTTANTSYTANLSPGKQYRWNVAACNSAGCSSFTAVKYFKTP
jgi:fibronectin type 3 domain-containing protein